MNGSTKTALLILAFGHVFSASSATLRVRDIAFVSGTQPRECSGIGLVYGLAQGDKDPSQAKAFMTNSLRRFGVHLPPEALSSKGIALVSVKAQIPAHSKSGTRVDMSLSGMNDAPALQGGILVQTPLFGADGEVYAVAQGPVTAAHRPIKAPEPNGREEKRIATGFIAGGAVAEKEIPVTLISNDAIRLIVRDETSTSTLRVAQAINAKFPDSSQPLNDTTVQVKVPEAFRTFPVDFIAQVQAVEIETAYPAQIIVINERTGSIVVNARVKVREVEVSSGKIVVNIAEELEVKAKPPSK